jgi:hypothetical protein
VTPKAEPRATPLIVRIAGLPTSAVAPLRGDLFPYLDRLEQLRAELAAARELLVERLFAAIHDASPELRRVLLAVKRASFNGRPLDGLRRGEGWPAALAAAGSEIEAVLDLEAREAAAEAEYVAAHGAEADRQRRALAELAGDSGFFRGIALSSLVMAENLPRLGRKPPAEWGRRERRLETGLLRFATRAALKLSPFATFTRIGLARVADDLPSGSFRFVPPGACRERPLVRLRRYLGEQYGDLLVRYEPLRLDRPVVMNATIERLATGQLRFLSPGRWTLPAGEKSLQFGQPALVRVDLKGKLIEWLMANLEGRPMVYREVIERIGAAFAAADPAVLRASLERLIDIDFVSMIPPVKSNELVIESSLHDFLAGRFADDPGLAPFAALLGETLELLADFPASPRPVEAVRRGQELVDAMWRQVAPLVGIRPDEASYRTLSSDHQFLEDTLLEGRDTPCGSVLELPRERARELLGQLRPLIRLSSLHNYRFDFMETLAAFAAKQWPGESEIGFFDFFEGTQKLFMSFLAWDTEERLYRSIERIAAFDPLELASVARLKQCREEVAARYRETLELREEHRYVCDGPALEGLLDRLEVGAAAAPRDASAFMQPLDPAGRCWVLNNLFEGLGRMSSRYSSLLGEPARDWWASSFAACSDHLADDGEEAEWVDLYCPAGHVINVHVPQTRRVLEIPAFTSGLPPERVLRLRDIRVRLGGREPRLVDREGRRIVPLHLGGLVFRFTPNLFKFLSMFSSAEYRHRKALWRRPPSGGVEHLARHEIGDVVYQRRAWLVEREYLPLLDGLEEHRAFAAVHSWRRKIGLPEQVFVLAPLTPGVEVPDLKPQFLDFSSPLLVELFRSVLQIPIPLLRFFEALPSPQQMLPDGRGDSWALEVQLDSLGI